MKPLASHPDPAATDRYRSVGVQAVQAALLVALVAAMGVCLALGPQVAALLLQ